jgi:hypothetical protein
MRRNVGEEVSLVFGQVVLLPTILGEQHFIVTSILSTPDGGVAVLTPMPDGMGAHDLGRKFVAAKVIHLPYTEEQARG